MDFLNTKLDRLQGDAERVLRRFIGSRYASTTPEPEAVRQYMIAYLMEQGYPDYAALLYGMQMEWLFWTPYPAAVIPVEKLVMLNPSFCIRTDPETKERELNPDWAAMVSILFRHELLHCLLRHKEREGILHKNTADKHTDACMRAMDFEVSNYYSAEDAEVWNRNPDCFFGGLCVWSEFQSSSKAVRPDFQGLPFEQILAMLLKEEQEEQAEQEGESCGRRSKRAKSKVQGQQEKQQKNSSAGSQESADQQDAQGGQDQQDGQQDGQEDGGGQSAKKCVSQWQEERRMPYGGELPCTPEFAEEVVQNEKQRQEQHKEERKMTGGPSAGTGEGTEWHEKALPDAEYMRSSLQYDLNMFFGQSGKFTSHRDYSRPNKKYSGSDVIIRSRHMRPKDRNQLALFVDRSGSFNEAKTTAAENIFAKLKMMKNVDLQVFYFAQRAIPAKQYKEMKPKTQLAYLGSGTYYSSVMDAIKLGNFRNVAIISDWDSLDNRTELPSCVESVFYCAVDSLRAQVVNCGAEARGGLVAGEGTVPPCLQLMVQSPIMYSAWKVTQLVNGTSIRSVGKGEGGGADVSKLRAAFAAEAARVWDGN